jgi:uroporphyrin-III C-methyltransferase
MLQQFEHLKNLEPQPRLTVVGAGPGDPELITLKAIKTLESANVVLYDALVDTSLLTYCSEACEKIYVGKKPGESHSQDAINQLIVEKAFALGHVVRLKGGDPFVFGRGQEEIDFASQYGLITGYVPGISSSIAAPSAANIPLTVRGVSDGFWVMTGTKSDGSLSSDLQLGLQSNATLIILMGMNQLESISKICHAFGKGAVAAAIVHSATTSQQKVGFGFAGELDKIAQKNELSNPAVIVIGEVVRYADKQWWENVQKSIQNYDKEN